MEARSVGEVIDSLRDWPVKCKVPTYPVLTGQSPSGSLRGFSVAADAHEADADADAADADAADADDADVRRRQQRRRLRCSDAEGRQGRPGPVHRAPTTPMLATSMRRRQRDADSRGAAKALIPARPQTADTH
jgi:hypothetical protein